MDTRSLPYIYQVSDVMDKKAGGYYYGAELSRVPKMTPERILKRKLGKNGKRLGFAKFKDYDRYCNSYCFSQFLYIMISFVSLQLIQSLDCLGLTWKSNQHFQ